MRLVVCGCSWSSECHRYPDTGYGSYLAEMLGAEYINLARPSASNYIIRLQIDYAVKNLKPDILVVGWTTPHRFEWQYDQSVKFDGTLKSVTYFDDHERTNDFHPIPENTPCITADSWNSIFGQYYNKHSSEDVMPLTNEFLNENQFQILKHFYLNFVSQELSKSKDTFLIESAVSQLTQSNTKFLMSSCWKEGLDFIPAENYIDVHPQDIMNKFRDVTAESKYTHHLVPKKQKFYATEYVFPAAKKLLEKI